MITLNQKIWLISLSIFILVAISSYYQGYLIASQRTFMCLMYVALLITFYFSYSLKVAHKMIEKQIKLVVNEMKNIMTFYNFKPQKLPPIGNDSNNQDVTKENKTILHKSIVIIVFCFILSFIISFAIWYSKNSSKKIFRFSQYQKQVILKNFYILVLVLIVQIIFSTLIIKNVLPLNTQDIIKKIINTILKDKEEKEDKDLNFI